MRPCYNRIDIEIAKRTAREYCRKNGLSEHMLDRQMVFVINDNVIFAQPSTRKPMGLRNDRETQPIPTLIAEKKENDFFIKPTDYTYDVLGEANMK